MESTNLKQLPDELLQERLSGLVKAEKRLTAEIIEYVKEVDVRRLYLKWGFTSLFQYLTESLGYTPASAQRRIDSARLLKDIPELKQELQSGALNLMQVSTLARHVREKQKQEKVTVSRKREILDSIKHQDLRASERTICKKLNVAPQVVEKQHVQRDESVRLEITLTKEQMALLDEVKSLSSHITAGKNLSEIIEFLATQYLKAKKPKVSKMKGNENISTSILKIAGGESTFKRKAGTAAAPSNMKVRGSVATSKVEAAEQQELVREQNDKPAMTPTTSRYIPTAIKRSLFEKQKCCQWRDLKTNAICGSRFQLQIDHKQPVWAGGGNGPDNLQLLCGVHNRLKYKREAGFSC